jgi:pyruvate dehydrogenase (quinone)
MEGAPEFGIELQPIDFAGVALACGAAGYTVEDPAQVESVLRDALAHPGPAVVQAVVDPNEPELPGHITSEQALNFMEAMAKGDRERAKIIKTVLKNKNSRSGLSTRLGWPFFVGHSHLRIVCPWKSVSAPSTG